MRTKSRVSLKTHTILFLLLFSVFVTVAQAFCHPGCLCEDELKQVSCENVTSIPILLHPMLKSLTLTRSRSLKLDAVSIGLYQELELLDLSDNSITELPNGFLHSLKKLKTLRLSDNQLKVVDENLVGEGNLQQLQKLDLSGNQLERVVPLVFQGLEHLSALNLSHNQLYLLQPTAFTGLTKHLKKLDLSYNRFARLTTGFFNETPALTELNLAGNIFSELSSFLFSAQRRLSQLDLSSNLLISIDPQAFSGLYSLKKLNLAKNLLPIIGGVDTGLSPNWKFLPELEMIDLSGNSIKQMHANAFQGLFSLKELRLKDMPALTEIQENSFSGLVSLERLHISGCPLLTQLHPNAFGHHQSSLSLNQRGGRKLKHLDLSYNQLSSLDTNMLEWQELKWLNLAGNRWDCNCKLLDFLPVIARRLGNQGEAAYCTLPDQMYNVQIREITSPTTCTTSLNDPLFNLISLAAFLTILTLFTLLLLLCCCRQQNSKLLSKCCSPSSASNNQSRLPLYNTGSSFTESLIYEKGMVPLKPGPLMPNFTTTLRNPNSSKQANEDSGSEGYYYSIMPLAGEQSCLDSDQSTLRIGQLPGCQIAHPPYLLHNRSMVGLNRVLHNGYSRPPSFTAPPPPPVEERRDRSMEDFEVMNRGYETGRRNTEVV